MRNILVEYEICTNFAPHDPTGIEVLKARLHSRPTISLLGPVIKFPSRLSIRLYDPSVC